MRGLWLVTVLLLAALVGMGLEVASLRRQIQELAATEAGDEELSPYMLRLQLYADKLYFAGRGGNWALAGFYLEELAETSDAVVAAEVIEGEVDVSAVMESLLPEQIGDLEEAVDKGDRGAFAASYRNMLEACNSCHRSTAHGFLVLQEPTHPSLTNQAYEVVGSH